MLKVILIRATLDKYGDWFNTNLDLSGPVINETDLDFTDQGALI
jgi:hypothetical protein